MRFQEDALIAFSPGELPPGPWLVFAPHADDETFGMGGSLLRARDAGLSIHVVIVTDGALGGSGEDLVARRQAEIGAVAESLRLDSLEFWSEPDRGVSVCTRLRDAAVAEIQRVTPGSVFFPGPLELHPDHRATGMNVWQALQQARNLGLTPQALSYEIGVQNPANLLLDISAVQPEKAELMTIYASQNGENNYPELVTALDKARTFTLPPPCAYAEAFYRFALEDLDCPLDRVVQAVLDRYLQS